MNKIQQFAIIGLCKKLDIDIPTIDFIGIDASWITFCPQNAITYFINLDGIIENAKGEIINISEAKETEG